MEGINDMDNTGREFKVDFDWPRGMISEAQCSIEPTVIYLFLTHDPMRTYQDQY